jgi:class 3 adenylate cyclase
MEARTARDTFERLGTKSAAEAAGRLVGQFAGPSEAPDRVRRAFMFTDIVKSTDLVSAIGDEAWEKLLAWHDETLRSMFASKGGQVAHHTGDGFFVAFASPSSALECAVAVQRALAEHRRVHGFAPFVRMGVHSAEATRRGEDYSGGEVHKAARVAALAEASEILATADTAATVGVGAFVLSEPRTVSLKGIPRPLEVVAVEWR